MRGHDTEIGKPEAEFVFCVLQCHEHNFSAQLVFKHPYFVICPAGYMIEHSGYELSFLSHTLYRVQICILHDWERKIFLFFCKAGIPTLPVAYPPANGTRAFGCQAPLRDVDKNHRRHHAPALFFPHKNSCVFT